MRAATWSFESWSLDFVAQTLLGRGKHIDTGTDDSEERVDEIRRMWREDPAALAEYNLEDCRLVLGIFERAHLLDFVVERQRLTGLPMDRAGGAVSAFDNLYLPRLHRNGHVAPDTGIGVEIAPTPGGHVMDSEPGLFDNVIVLDFKSLYPSIIRTFRIDPMGLAFPGDDPVAGFDGATFARERHILPGLIETLWSARDRAKRQGNGPLSQAIKIQMNSFYGVLGTPACRFFSPRLASSITRRGHEILARTREFIEERGYRVLYGDTDSLFVLLGEGKSARECETVGSDLAEDLTEWWRRRIREEHRVESALELEFETHYVRFFMPTLRGSDRGTKKRYAGTVREGKEGSRRLVFKGLEAVRTDWTPLARRFQRELYRRVFEGEPYEAWARSLVDELFAGKLDDELLYRKRLRRGPDAYTKALPPHVQAARKLGRSVRVVSYYITTRGPEPASLLESPIDYDHYLERQLAPAADGLLHFLGTDLLTLAGRQMTLF
jgi:DNA polymerase-2